MQPNSQVILPEVLVNQIRTSALSRDVEFTDSMLRITAMALQILYVARRTFSGVMRENEIGLLYAPSELAWALDAEQDNLYQLVKEINTTYESNPERIVDLLTREYFVSQKLLLNVYLKKDIEYRKSITSKILLAI